MKRYYTFGLAALCLTVAAVGIYLGGGLVSPTDGLQIGDAMQLGSLAALGGLGVMANAIPEQFKIVQMAWPQTTNGGFTSDYVSMKNAHKATIIIDVNQAVGHATVFTLRQSTDNAGGTTAAGPSSTRVWVNEDVAASDTLVKGTNAAAETLTNDAKKKQIVFEIDAAELTAGYDYIYFTAADSSQATNFASATVLLHTRYPQATPPSAIA